MNDIQRADPVARRTAVAIVGCGTGVGVVLLTVAHRVRAAFEAWLQRDMAARLPLVVVVLAIVTAGPVLGLAAYLWHLGRRIVRAERYPPPRLRVTRDTPIVTGAAASRRGRRMQVLAAGLCVVALLMAVFLWRLVALLRPGGA